MERVVCIVLGYIFGLFQTGYIYGRLNNVDIRKHGSGNAGTTNALRVLGKKAGIITYVGDLLKSIIAGIIVRFLFSDSSVDILVLILYTGLGVILGHNFPFYLKFKGGKGIAASSGVIISLLDWKLTLICLIIFILVIVLSKYMSLGSLTMMAGFLIGFIVFTKLNIIKISEGFMGEAYILVIVIVLLAFFQHRSNIVRLLKGSESKLFQKKEG